MIRALRAYKVVGTDKVITDKTIFEEDVQYEEVTLLLDSEDIKQWAEQLEMCEDEEEY